MYKDAIRFVAIVGLPSLLIACADEATTAFDAGLPDGDMGAANATGARDGGYDVTGGVSDAMGPADVFRAPDVTPPAGGYVRIRVQSAAIHNFSVEAETVAAPLQPCTVREFGACRVSKCVTGSPIADSPRVGTLTLRGGLVDLDVDRMGAGYQFSQRRGELFEGGETLTIKTTGAAVPAASFTLTAVDYTQWLTPDLLGSGAYTLDRSKDFAFTWMARSNGEFVTLRFNVQLSSAPLDFRQVECTYAATEGRGVVPREALLELPVTTALYIGAEIKTRATMDVGDYRYTTTVSRFLTTARGVEINRGNATVVAQ